MDWERLAQSAATTQSEAQAVASGASLCCGSARLLLSVHQPVAAGSYRQLGP